MTRRLILFSVFVIAGCHRATRPQINPKDMHTYSNPQDITVTHIDLDLETVFEQKTLRGNAVLALDIHHGNRLVLDSKNLQIDRAEASPDGAQFREVRFDVAKADPILGSPVTLDLPSGTHAVRIQYSSSPSAGGLQWLTPEQTADKSAPFLYSQNEPILARSWIPCQDSPSVRVTYNARIRAPKGLTAVMSAEQLGGTDGEYRFAMHEAIPSYLIALAVGKLDFRATGSRTGVYAEPSVVANAANEFSDMEKMVEAAESLFGPYRWGRFDVLVLPPSFPFGGMENPRLTFLTPTVLAGDKSLVSVIAHELGHSWSGNLVTNATWSDFWLNEGFTVYCERRILEQVYGRDRADAEAVLGRQTLMTEMATLPPKDQVLHVDLKGRDPDEGFTTVPYEKGFLFLRTVEEKVGRTVFDAYLKNYFDHFAFQSITTTQAIQYLKENLLTPGRAKQLGIDVNAWMTQPGIPAGAATATSSILQRVDEAGTHLLTASPKVSRNWTTFEWLRYLNNITATASVEDMAALDRNAHLTQTGNSEVLDQWLLMAIKHGYKPAYGRLEDFLLHVGRRKYIKPLYEELVKTSEGKEFAQRVYAQARNGYHPIAQGTIDKIVGYNSGA